MHLLIVLGDDAALKKICVALVLVNPAGFRELNSSNTSQTSLPFNPYNNPMRKHPSNWTQLIIFLLFNTDAIHACTLSFVTSVI